ncbi:hypothetical protein OHA40_11375 [Nocardia sp. NBC_00508]|uniref:hypothetical protein n=1 Tax=Nocardia sp. NBC_00508 TaxID=2975992 RepID=UPI002E80B988|nr:hypothetical protein [Nocardia sp. NBC_00508]WUD68656.1 hypothetical protein OHA40_11375 [Nocardia sp. NBC_00508]
MAADEIETYTEKLRTAGADTSKADEDLLSIVAAAEGAATRASIAAGPDKFGSKFRDGKEGFDNTMDSINDGTRNIATSFRRMSRGQYQAADAIDAKQQAATENFDRLV